jgi:tetratricopeptide (TPR) repeat protein
MTDKQNEFAKQVENSLGDDEQRQEQLNAFLSKLEAAKKADVPPTAEEEAYFQIDYQITDEVLADEAFLKLSEAEQKTYHEAFELYSQDPQQAIARLQELVERYPDIPSLANNLMALRQHHAPQAHPPEAAAKELWEQFPKYLFAMINHGKFLIDRGAFDELANMLNYQFKLSDLYPEKAVFHVSEHVNFLGLLGLYYSRQGRFSVAVMCYDLISQFDQDYPIVSELLVELQRNPLALALKYASTIDAETRPEGLEIPDDLLKDLAKAPTTPE